MVGSRARARSWRPCRGGTAHRPSSTRSAWPSTSLGDWLLAPSPARAFEVHPWLDYDHSLPPDSQGAAFACSDPTGVGSRLFFQRVPEGKVVKNRLHLDVRVGTGMVGEERLAALEAECARLLPLGATRVRLLTADEENESCLVMQDVEGNEFCLD